MAPRHLGVLLLCLLVVATTVTRAQKYPDVKDYGNCGGKSTHACAKDKRCASCKSKDFECVGADRPWYWQCLPKKAARAETQDEAEEEPTPPPRIPEGCTDRLASNFDLAAREDDGSCEYEGCTDRDADNYERKATIDDGSCVLAAVVATAAAPLQSPESAEVALPAATTTLPSATTTLPSPDIEDQTFAKEVGPWGRCGGINECGESKACARCSPLNGKRFVCREGNPWYWQCVEDDAAAEGEADQEVEAEQLPAEQAFLVGEANVTTNNATTIAAETPEATEANNTTTEAIDANATATNTTEFEIPEDSEGLAATTRFFDGCKASCAWTGNVGRTVQGFTAVTSCSKFDENGNQKVLNSTNVRSACGGGGEPDENGSVAYECVNRAPFDKDDQRYGFVAANGKCCECYELTFLDKSVDDEGNVCEGCSKYEGELAGSTMIVQVINSGGDLGSKQFDIQIPGGGYGIFNAVTGDEAPNGPALYGDSATSDWGERYGGVESRADCFKLPGNVQQGCLYRFDSLEGSDNPGVSYKRVKCGYYPELWEKSNCLLARDVV